MRGRCDAQYLGGLIRQLGKPLPFYVQPIPNFGVQKEPQPVAMVGPACEMGLEHLLDHGRPADPGLNQPGVSEEPIEECTELRGHQVRQRRREALLGPPEYLRREIALSQPHLEIAALASPNLEPRWEGCDELRQLVV